MTKKKKRLKKIRYRLYSLEQILPLIATQYEQRFVSSRIISGIKVNLCIPRNKIKFEGFEVINNSSRLVLFKHKGTQCIRCGLKATYFSLEGNKGENPSLALYGVTRKGKEVLMTKDHILPSSKKGPTRMYNLQPMCERCNQIKGNYYEDN